MTRPDRSLTTLNAVAYRGAPDPFALHVVDVGRRYGRAMKHSHGEGDAD